MRILENYIVPWATASVSLFNTIILVWLGLAVLLASPRRHVGTWLAGGGLLVGGAFFAGYTVMLDYTIETLLTSIRIWWKAGWVALLGLPGGWYALTLWYAGFWSNLDSALRRRQRYAAFGMSILALVLYGCVLFSSPIRLLADFASLNADSLTRNAVLFVLMFGYALYLPTCVALALDALRRPDPSGHLMRDAARRRARPWLIASTWVQLGNSILLVSAFGWMIATAVISPSLGTYNQMLMVFGGLELAAIVLVSVAVALVGKAIVSYEIFSDKALPRSTFLRQWRTIAMIAVFYSAVASVAMGFEVRGVYVLLAGTLALTIGLSMLSARMDKEREQGLAALRPFVAGGRWYEHVLAPRSQFAGIENSGDGRRNNGNREAFEALATILGASQAELHARGPMVAVGGPPLIFPPEAEPFVLHGDILQEASLATAKEVIPLNIEDDAWNEPGGARWAVPLRNARETIGVLFLGDKTDGALYTEEEMEIARAAGERLLDARAGATLAARLMVLQRQRLAESSMLDRRARRVLHDEVLPRLHAALLALPPEQAAAAEQLASAHREISDLLRDMPTGVAGDIARLGFFEALSRLQQAEFERAFDEVQWDTSETAILAAARLSTLQGETLFHASREVIRNAARYGRGEAKADGEPGILAPFRLLVSATVDDGGTGEELRVVIQDNGVGLGNGAQSQGSGQGLALHGTMMAVIGGTLQAVPVATGGTCILLTVPLEVLPPDCEPEENSA
jgi:signal transduction histidine kinase